MFLTESKVVTQAKYQYIIDTSAEYGFYPQSNVLFNRIVLSGLTSEVGLAVCWRMFSMYADF